MGVGKEGFFHCRVGMNHSLNVTLDPFLEELQKNYFTISVFTASRSCSLQATEHSRFHYESSLVSSVDYSFLLNTNQSLRANTTESISVLWSEDTALLNYDSQILTTLYPSPIFRLTFTLMGSVQSPSFFFISFLGSSQIGEGLCVLFTHASSVLASSTSSQHCTRASEGIAILFMIQRLLDSFLSCVGVQVILLETTSDEYTTYDVTLPDILYEGQPHSIRVEFHTLYQIILVYIDDLSSPVMVLDPWIPLTNLPVVDRAIFISEATVHAETPYYF